MICEDPHFTHMSKHLHDRIIPLRGNVWDHRTSLTPPLYFIEIAVPNQESGQSCICVLGYRVCLFTILLFDLGIVPTVWYFRIVPTVRYFGIVPTVWYFLIVPTVWYFRTVLSVVFKNCSDSVVFWNCSDSVVFWNCSDSVVF